MHLPFTRALAPSTAAATCVSCAGRGTAAATCVSWAGRGTAAATCVSWAGRETAAVTRETLTKLVQLDEV